MTILKNKLNVVLDIGKTNVKLIFLKNKKIVKEYKTKQQNSYFKNSIKTLEANKIVNWLIKKLKKESDKHILNNFVCTTHGCSLAFIDFDDKEIIACTDYEFPFDKYKEEFLKIEPKFSRSFTPLLEGGLNTGMQIFYFSKKFPKILNKTKFILSYPQYVAWKLSNVFASEITYIGCHSYLWDFDKNKYSQLVKKLNVEKKFPPMKNAWDVIGKFKNTKMNINILNGIHDSNASYLYFLNSNLKNFTLISTGTWYITLNQKTHIKKLKPSYDMLCGINAFGKSVPTMRFMGGREYDYLLKKLDVSTKKYSISDEKIKENLIYPSYASGGPFLKSKQNLKNFKKLNASEKYSLICIYIAFVINFVLEKMVCKNDLIFDGPVTNNADIMELVASLRKKQKTFKNNKEIGTGLGASILFNIKKKNNISLTRINNRNKFDLNSIYKIWLKEIKKQKLLKT